ncbi:MAG: methyltransferase family protein [bacterium]
MASKTHKNQAAVVRKSAIVLGFLATLEVIIMISPFAAYFYSFFRPFLNIYSQWEVTSWLDGFFLNHALVSTSPVLEWQREIGRFLFAAGIWGFLISFIEVYGRKIFSRGVARFGLYALVRHPQYLSLAVAGWGLLTIWPRFFLLVLYVTMLFVYFLLAAHEERRMAVLYPETYLAYATGKGSFLPGSPGDWLYRRTFARMPTRALGFVGCYVSVLALAVLGAFLTRGQVQANVEMVARPEVGVYGFSCWPQGKEKLTRVVNRVLAGEAVRSKMDENGKQVFFLHALPADYGMTGMFYRLDRPQRPARKGSRFLRIASYFLLPRPQIHKGSGLMGHPQDKLKVVVSRAYQPWRKVVHFEEALQPGTKMLPIAVVTLDASKEEGPLEVSTPIPENAWGNLTMPIF